MRDAAWGELLVWAWSGGYGSRLQWGMLPEVSFWCGRGVEVMVQGCNEGCLPEVSFWCGRGVEVMVQGCNEGCLPEVSFWCGRGVEVMVQGCNEGCCLRWASGVGVEWRLWFKAAMRDACLRWASGVGVEWRLWFKAAMRDACLRWASGVGVEWRLWFKAAMRDACLRWASGVGVEWRLGFKAARDAAWGELLQCGRGVEAMVQGCNEYVWEAVWGELLQCGHETDNKLDLFGDGVCNDVIRGFIFATKSTKYCPTEILPHGNIASQKHRNIVPRNYCLTENYLSLYICVFTYMYICIIDCVYCIFSIRACTIYYLKLKHTLD